MALRLVKRELKGLKARAWIIITVNKHMNTHRHKTIYIPLEERLNSLLKNLKQSFQLNTKMERQNSTYFKPQPLLHQQCNLN